MNDTISNELATVIESDIKKYNVTDKMIADLQDKYSSLRIQSIEDKAGFEMVSSARKDIKRHIASIEIKRKELKAYSILYGKAVDAEASRITAKLEEVMFPLQQMEIDFEREKERIKREVDEANRKKIQSRIDSLNEIGCRFDFFKISIMPDPEFLSFYQSQKTIFDDNERKRAEEIKQKEDERKAYELKAESERKRLELEKIEVEKKLNEERRLREEIEKKAAFAKEEEARVRNAEEQRLTLEQKLKEDALIKQKEAELIEAAKQSAIENHLAEISKKDIQIEQKMIDATPPVAQQQNIPVQPIQKTEYQMIKESYENDISEADIHNIMIISQAIKSLAEQFFSEIGPMRTDWASDVYSRVRERIIDLSNDVLAGTV
jgi:hypothetical protein